MLVNILFYIIFISQIFLISYYYPKKIINRVNWVINKYPPNQYSKLYPESITKTQKGQRNYWLINQAIILVGVFLLYSYWSSAQENPAFYQEAESWPIFFGMVQCIPFILLELSGFKHFKLMRKADTRKSRTADLTPRRLFDFISPVLIVLAFTTYIFACLFSLYIDEFTFAKDSLVIISALTLSNAVSIAVTVFNLSGTRLDPHQSTIDRNKQISFTIKSVTHVSIYVSLFIIAHLVIRHFDIPFIEIMINSIYFQLVIFLGIGAMLNQVKVEELNFDVYKSDNSVTDSTVD